MSACDHVICQYKIGSQAQDGAGVNLGTSGAPGMASPFLFALAAGDGHGRGRG